ncbi:hypothetical protein ACIA5C_23930 [Actinoplanes sp. NPDC051343]|uniref:hypothetical protein n=1 Tax=Actinoplanes sp. NPDC051343 TaxID=3363906 RepID=UPI0037B3010C
MDDGTSIDIPQLMALGDDVAGIGARLVRAAGDIDGWRGSATGAVGGSVTCEVALGMVADHWHSSLGMLARAIQEHGRSLHRAAADYDSADLAAGRRIGRAGAAVARILSAGEGASR